MKSRPLLDNRTLPLLIEPETPADSAPAALSEWLATNGERVDGWLHRHGALLLRGFALTTADEFAAVCASLTPELRLYIGGDSPREKVAERVYTASEYPAGLEVRLHNELSYGAWWPERVFFFCARSAARGGETHIADGREVYRSLPGRVREAFASKGVRYLQHLPDAASAGERKSWQQTFDTDERAAVERHCRDSGMQWSWTRQGLTTATACPGVLQHPHNGEMSWFNQADQWHAALSSVKHPGAELTGAEPSAHATYGDGTEIDAADLQSIRRTCARCEVVYPWRDGDMLVLDNILTMHGRKPYQGEREVLVAMG